MNVVAKRIAKLQKLMRERRIDIYLVPTSDYHESEYVGEHFACREYITGFTGSAGTALIGRDWARLWTDGRYFVQAEAELAGSGVKLMKMGEPGVPTVEEFLEQNMPSPGIWGLTGGCSIPAWARICSGAWRRKMFLLPIRNPSSAISGRTGPPCPRGRCGCWRKNTQANRQKKRLPDCGRK